MGCTWLFMLITMCDPSFNRLAQSYAPDTKGSANHIAPFVSLQLQTLEAHTSHAQAVCLAVGAQSCRQRSATATPPPNSMSRAWDQRCSAPSSSATSSTIGPWS
ncbi:hypothetical protein PF005_g14296 [Phytophthora fragariae]|uniref:Secreted protein n=1 Tax=Phytophthora fragariae TaxID=53985 RepID=A0A6A3S8Y6_9STRA|nr:hypothetical protein PF003_g6730 [Phytophthora fragariae]KAE8936773.1 hypothetical protein PF009_g13307 [Phytophthora fragariae]KAE8984755.1 hypothetical protein PF011_g20660 [Phytophthora fragariae]KAE9090975.1 hypothetical protein PF010_g18382 [Phytophthora fragariae]KAE9102046.1 hypothetical protein PF007_g14898 [Phytophthora fragariae]